MSTTTEYVAARKINQYETGEETVHAADPSAIKYEHSRPLVTTRCGVRYADAMKVSFDSYRTGFRAICSRCDALIAKENAAAFTKEAVADLSPADLLRRYLTTLPQDFYGRGGINKAIEVLEEYGAKVDA